MAKVTSKERRRIVNNEIQKLIEETENEKIIDLSADSVAFGRVLLPILTDPRLLPSEKCVHFILSCTQFSFRNDGGPFFQDRVWLAQKTIGNMLNLSKKQVGRILDRLERMVLIKRVKFDGDNDSYIIICPSHNSFYSDHLDSYMLKNPNFFLVSFNRQEGFGKILVEKFGITLANQKEKKCQKKKQ